MEHLRAAGAHGYLVDVGDVRAMEPGLTGDFVGASFYPADLQCAPRAIARALGISEATVKAHLTRVYRHIGVDDRTQAATAALRRGFFHLENGTEGLHRKLEKSP